MSRMAKEIETGADWPESTILPEQFLGEPSDAEVRGVKGLMIAVLEDAIACIAGGASHSAKARMAAIEATRWIRSTDTSYPFAFESICHVLSLDGDRLRRRLLAAEPAAGNARRVPSARRVENNLSRIVAPRVRRRGAARVAAEAALHAVA